MLPLCSYLGFGIGMGNGKWTRIGRRGAWLGHSLEVGWALRGSVSKTTDGRWHSTINATDLETWKTEEEAMKCVEEHITRQVRAILEDWAILQRALASPDSRPGKKGRTPGPTDTP